MYKAGIKTSKNGSRKNHEPKVGRLINSNKMGTQKETKSFKLFFKLILKLDRIFLTKNKNIRIKSEKPKIPTELRQSNNRECDVWASYNN